MAWKAKRWTRLIARIDVVIHRLSRWNSTLRDAHCSIIPVGMVEEHAMGVERCPEAIYTETVVRMDENLVPLVRVDRGDPKRPASDWPSCWCGGSLTAMSRRHLSLVARRAS